MAQHPLVGRGTHREGADIEDELGVARFVDITKLKQPFKRVVDGSDESVEAAGRVVLGSHGRGMRAVVPDDA
jgi:hypothetical protein